MAGTNVKVTYERLEETAAAMDHGRESLLNWLGNLQNGVVNLTSKGFRTDTASGRYEAAYRELTAGIGTAVSALEGMAGFLRAAKSVFEENDAALAGQF